MLESQAEAHLRALIESTTDLIWSVDLSYGLLTFNKAASDNAKEMPGIYLSEGMHPGDYLSPESAELWKSLYERALNKGPFQTDYALTEGRTLEFALNPILQNGKATGVSVFGKDITGWKRTVNALRKTEEKFARTFYASPAATTVTDLQRDGKMIDVNAAFERMTGFRREEVIGRTALELNVWVNPQQRSDALKQVAATGSVSNFECCFRRKSGAIGTGLVSRLEIELDGIPCAITSTIDITELKQAEAEMRNLTTAIEQSADIIVITDATGAIQYCNPAFEKTTGYVREEAIARNPRILKSGKHGAEVYKRLWGTLTRGEVWAGQLINKKKDGSLYQNQGTISPIRGASERITGYVAVMRDVTSQRQLEDQLRQARKVETIGRLASGVAHDFNNILTVINGYSDFLVESLKPADPLRSYAQEIRTAGEHASGLARQLLAFGRKQDIEPRILNLNTIIRGAVPMLRSLIREDIKLDTRLEPALGQVSADSSQLHQVIMNLVVNARDAMPDGGNLEIGTANVDFNPADVAATAEAIPGHYVCLTVADTGIGMSDTVRKQIFEPFFTTKESGTGTGLGLATVQSIVSQYGGWINLWSEPGKGSWFKLYFPRVDAREVEVNDVSLPAKSVPAGGGHILVVEDQQAVRSFIRIVLKKQGYEVLEAADGESALTVAADFSGEIHLLLTDVVLPGISGTVLAERLRASYPALTVLFMSGYITNAISDRAASDDAIGSIAKPFRPDEIVAKVQEMLMRRPPQ